MRYADDDPLVSPFDAMIDAANKRLGAQIHGVITRALARLGVDARQDHVGTIVAAELRARPYSPSRFDADLCEVVTRTLDRLELGYHPPRVISIMAEETRAADESRCRS